ncbi:MAG: DUF2027 domain-containing protein [Bacteroidales bacterium]|jgi:hypothetical protein|nr:DUF2027 domain-containing protein [Bacteroidales bacterium]
MRFKIGDKVNFLNERGGGTVIGIIDNKLVKLKTNDGFEMPVLSADLILDYRSMPAEDFTEPLRIPETSKIQQEEIEEPGRISEINPWGAVKEEKGLYFAFEPHEQQWLLTGDMDVILINHTSYDILYSLFFEIENVMEGIDYGSLPADSKIVLDTISRDEIEKWLKGYIQVLFHRDLPDKLYQPLHSDIEIKPARFFKEGNYLTNTMLQGKALILTLSLQSALTVVSKSDYQKKFNQSNEAKATEPAKEKPFIDKHKINLNEAVVDLHIGEIVENIAGLTSLDMLNLQLAYFKKALQSAISNDYTKATFIHGVGNGVLKAAIIKELEDYEGVENRMASISKFGVGAIDILIKDK